LEDATEINCSVLGLNEPVASPCERPFASGQLLSYDDKYLHGKAGKRGGEDGMQGMVRELPAAIPAERAAKVQELAVAAFKALDCAGVARVDTLVTTSGDVYLNEINTVPGSLASYLWEAAGMTFSALLDRLVEIALEGAREKRRTRFSTRPS
jgi:D-alanine-D-alanine ligase